MRWAAKIVEKGADYRQQSDAPQGQQELHARQTPSRRLGRHLSRQHRHRDRLKNLHAIPLLGRACLTRPQARVNHSPDTPEASYWRDCPSVIEV
jgi:hypothetical protein